MINTVRNTVLSVLNKNNYGYLSPSDFNLFAKQAQLDIFENYFYEYNYQINKENARQSGTGYADIKKGIEEAIDIFSETKGIYTNASNTYFLPSPTTTGSDYYLLNKVLIYQSILTEGTSTGTVGGGNQLIDSNADFITDGISVGDIIAVENGGVQYIPVTGIVSATQLLTTSISTFNLIGLKYTIFLKASKLQEAESVSHSKITMLNNSILTSPSLTYPAYTQQNLLLTAFPDSLDAVGQLLVQYIRYPKEPRWTYISLLNGEPVFDASQGDYQDFEIPLDDEVNLILKILQYAGISIREADIYQFGQSEETQTKQEQS
mgnify:FL=1|tara:strand:+ start:2137 stop:3096 length:960 start_codon:yes stop_codon:yes gene_type:complete